jgi:cytochrome c-type biogenesis protein CcmE
MTARQMGESVIPYDNVNGKPRRASGKARRCFVDEAIRRFPVNSRLKRRLIVVTGVIVIVVTVVLAVVSGATASRAISVAEAASGAYNGVKGQVTGKVVDNSYSIEGNVLSFSITEGTEDAEEVQDATGSASATGSATAIGSASAIGSATAPGDPAPAIPIAAVATPVATVQLRVVYDCGVSATFGNQVTAICTGVISDDGVLVCSELVTKCPSKYESATSALDVARLLSYGAEIIDKPVKVTGTIKEGTLGPVGRESRFVLVGQGDEQQGDGQQDGRQADDEQQGTGQSVAGDLPVLFDGALPDEVQDGSVVILTGSLNSAGQFAATNVALPAPKG